MSIKVVIREGTSELISPQPLPKELYRALSWHDDSYTYTWRYREHGWDGWTSLLVNNQFPTGLLSNVLDTLTKHNIEFTLENHLEPVSKMDRELFQEVCKELTLRDYQILSFAAILNYKYGLIRMPTGVGKTRIGLAMAMYANRLGEPVAILSPTKGILRQWVDKGKEVGMKLGWIEGGRKPNPQDITVISIQKANKHLDMNYLSQFMGRGWLITDEVHFWAADTYYATTRTYFGTCARRYGMTATLMRSDSKEIYYHANMGDQIVNYSYTDAIEGGYIVPPIIRFQKLNNPIQLTHWEIRNWSGRGKREGGKKRAIINNIERNQKIVRNFKSLLKEKRPSIIFVDEEEHGKLLQNEYGLEDFPLICSKNKVRFQLLEDFTNGEIDGVIGTTMIDVGIDIPRASGAVMASGGKSPVRYYQRIGRLLRPFPDLKTNEKKNALIYDFCDNGCSVVENHAMARANILVKEPKFKVQTDSDLFHMRVGRMEKIRR
jgi:superfamily II DNA or RNA helicase